MTNRERKPTPEERERIRAVAEKLAALPPDRQEAFEGWLTRAYAKATKPKRGRGRPPVEDPMDTSYTFRTTKSRLREMEEAAARLKLPNVAAYVRWLHEHFVEALGIKEGRKG